MGLNWGIPRTDGETVGMTKNISLDRGRNETWTREDLQNTQLERFNNFHQSEKQNNKYVV
jgi:hypothetical protein